MSLIYRLGLRVDDRRIEEKGKKWCRWRRLRGSGGSDARFRTRGNRFVLSLLSRSRGLERKLPGGGNLNRVEIDLCRRSIDAECAVRRVDDLGRGEATQRLFDWGHEQRRLLNGRQPNCGQLLGRRSAKTPSTTPGHLLCVELGGGLDGWGTSRRNLELDVGLQMGNHAILLLRFDGPTRVMALPWNPFELLFGISGSSACGERRRHGSQCFIVNSSHNGICDQLVRPNRGSV